MTIIIRFTICNTSLQLNEQILWYLNTRPALAALLIKWKVIYFWTAAILFLSYLAPENEGSATSDRGSRFHMRKQAAANLQ